MHNVFACLVHENRACVIDLVRNLRRLDPASTVLLYNGGDPELLAGGFPFDRLGAVVHPHPRRMAWGRLHDFALDCMRFAQQHLAFDALTIVDSDQLAVRPGYSDYLAPFLRDRPRLGVLSSNARRRPADNDVPPAASAAREFDRWRPFLRRFPNGEAKWVYWSFWPSTVFTAAAARDLTRLVDSDAALRELLAHTSIDATEETLLPTLVALLGYEITENPCSYDYIRFRIAYPPEYIDGAMTRPDVFWVHPVPRRYDDPTRERIRSHFRHYRGAEPVMSNVPDAPALREPGLPTPAILARMKTVEGWFSEEEAVLLAAATAHALRELPGPAAVVEIGSYCGRSTIVLAEAARAADPPARVFAIDPYDGVVGALDRGLHHGAPTFDRFLRNVEEAGLGAVVEPIRAASHEVPWERPIGLLFIDGLHDYPSVAADFHHFEAHVLPGGYVAFHDYADYYPGVQTFVDELLAGGTYRPAGRAGSLIVVRKDAPVPADGGAGTARPEAAPDTIWLYWEGPTPAYISLCCKSVFAHNRNVRLLDRAAFDALFHEDRDVPLEALRVEHRADFIRAYLLHHYGGLWVDTDCVVLRGLGPLLAAAREHGFAGYRETLGYMSGNLMAAVPGGALIAEYYQEVCRLIRSGRPLQWLDTTSISLDRAAALLPGQFYLAPTDLIMPLCWSQSERLCAVADAASHEALVRSDAYCYMLSHNTIKGRRETRLLCHLSEEELLAGPWFLSHLFRKALGVRPGPEAAAAGAPDGPTHFDEGAFDYLAARFAVRSMVDVGCGPGGMVYYARSRGVKALGVAAAGAGRGRPGLVEHDYARGPLFLGDFDLGWSVDFACGGGGRLSNCLATFGGCQTVFVTAPDPEADAGRAAVYWAARFAEAGFALDAEATEQVRERSTMESSYTREGGLVFVRAGRG